MGRETKQPGKLPVTPIVYVTDATPPLIPVTAPVSDPTAIKELPLLQTPPGTVFVSVTKDPVHTDAGPKIAAGLALTVTDLEAMQPVGPIVYVMVTTPAEMPETIPVDKPTAAIPVLLLLHVPPDVASVSVVAVPAHMLAAPLIGEGEGKTVIDLVTVHPVPSEYVMRVVPVATPVTTPLREPTLTCAELQLHQPPGIASVRVVLLPVHTADAPMIAVGKGLTVIIFVALQPVGNV